MFRKTGSAKSRSGMLALASAALVALIAAPLAGSAALSNGGFSIKAQDDGNADIFAIYGRDKADEGTPVEPEVPEVPAGAPDEIVFTVNPSLCVNPAVPTFNAGGSPKAKIDWGDGRGPLTLSGVSKSAYASKDNKDYKVVIKGTVPTITSLKSAAPGAASCFKSVDYIGENVGVTNLGNSFQGANNITKFTNIPSTVTSTYGMFSETPGFNADLSKWDTSNVTFMGSMFLGATSFDGDLSKWKTSKVTNTANMFENATSFTGKGLANWDMSAVTDSRSMFKGAIAFDGNITNWNLSNATDVTSMFSGAKAFNKGLNWNLAKATSLDSMFQGASSFNGDISGMKTPLVTRMGSTFEGASKFDGDLTGWDVSKVTVMTNMFKDASAFTGKGLETWNTGSVTNMANMFYGATVFNGAIGNWTVTKVTTVLTMFQGNYAMQQNMRAWTSMPASNCADWKTWLKVDPSWIPYKCGGSK